MRKQTRAVFILFLSLLCFVTSSSAQAKKRKKDSEVNESPWRITPVAGLNLTTASMTSANQASLQSQQIDQGVGAGISFGVLVGYLLLPKLEIESGLVYSHQRINESINDPTYSLVGNLYTTFNYLQIPVVARYSFYPFFSAGGGFYYARGIGSIVTNADVPNANFSNATAYYDAAGMSRGDFGFILSARAYYPLMDKVTAIFDARYLLGVVNISQDGNSDDDASLRQLQLLAGISFAL